VFIDSRTLPEKHVVETDICIIGGGAAGITMSKEYAGSSFSVCVLESGGFDPDADTQALYSGKNIGVPYFPLTASRLRYFGGTTNHWAGVCRPFSKEDFEHQEWVPHSGWPIGLQDLLPYYKRASAILKLNTRGWGTGYWDQYEEFSKLKFPDGEVKTRIALKAQEPTMRLGKSYRDEIKQLKNVSVYLHANVTDIESDVSGKEVSRLKVACLSGNKFFVKARFYVLAVGGIENPRLLLLSNNSQPAGLGNQNDLVGRYFMEHPRFLAGKYTPSEQSITAELYNWHYVKHSLVKGYLVFPKGTLQAQKMVDIQVRLDPARISSYVEASNSTGVESYHEVLDSISHFDAPDELSKHISNIISDIDDIALTAYRKIKYGGYPIEVSLYPRIDQTPNPDSRVTLSDDIDSLGQRKSQLDWQLSELDMHSVKKAMEMLGTELGKAGLGRLQTNTADMETWPADVQGGWHHMGTTRMSDDAKDGVVDKNCQVFGMSNLFIAGSSVFPTAGSGTPTLTLMALAIRLADFIKEKMV
jgi:choline dehydrogenase-like flavoprotein